MLGSLSLRRPSTLLLASVVAFVSTFVAVQAVTPAAVVHADDTVIGIVMGQSSLAPDAETGVMGNIAVSNTSPSDGEIVRVTVTAGAWPPKDTGTDIFWPGDADPDEEEWGSGIYDMQFGASAGNGVYSGFSSSPVAYGPGVEPCISCTGDARVRSTGGQFNAIEPGSQYWIEYEANEYAETIYSQTDFTAWYRVEPVFPEEYDGRYISSYQIDAESSNEVLEASIDVDQQTFVSGKPVTVSGTFKNVTDGSDNPRPVTFAVAPRITGNGGAGYFQTVGGRTADGIKMFELAPGAEVDLDALVFTTPTAADSSFDIEFDIDAYKDNGFGGWDKVSDSSVEISTEDGSSATHEVLLAKKAEEEEDTNYVDCSKNLHLTFYVGCNLARGVETLAYSMGGLTYFVGSGLYTGGKAYVQTAQFGLWMLDQLRAAIHGDEAALNRLIQEITIDVAAVYQLGFETLQAVPPTIDAITAAVNKAFDELAEVLATGDIKLIVGHLAEMAGENLDMVFEALIAARVLAKTMRTITKDGSKEMAEGAAGAMARRNQKALDEATALAKTKPGDLPGSRILPAGLDVTDIPTIWRSWGLSLDNLQSVLRVAADEGVILAFRSRAVGAAKKIKDGIALPKPLGIKIKGVNDIDRRFLGYQDAWDELVVIADPPIPYTKAGSPERATSVEAFLDGKVELNINTPESRDLRARVKERLEERLDEVPDHDRILADWEANGGIDVDFDPEFNGQSRVFFGDKAPRRAVEFDTVTTKSGGNGLIVKMATPDGKKFLPITGDIDFLAMLTLDGRILGDTLNPIRFISENIKRARVYNKLRATVGMSHGESFSLIVKQLRSKYLAQGLDSVGGETLLAATPNGRLITTYFDDAFSTLVGGPNHSLVEASQARAFFGGLFSEVLSPERGLNVLTLERLIDLHSGFRRQIDAFTASTIGRILLGVGDDAVDPNFSRGGDVVRPDGSGGLERFAPPASSTSTDGFSELTVSRGSGGGQWFAVDTESVLRDGKLTLAPLSYFGADELGGSLGTSALTKDEMLVPSGSPFFEVGDSVVVDPGGGAEEVARIKSVSPFVFDAPLANDHEIGTMVVSLIELPSSLNPLTPARVFETRSGESTIDGEFEGVGRLEAGSVTEVQVSGRGGVAVGATAVAANVTAIQPSGVGFVTLFPCGEDQPLTSSLNYRAGGAAGNSGIVKLNAAGELCVFTQADTDLVIDVNAWLAQAPSFASLTPSRLAETRSGEVTVDGEEQELGRLEAGSVTEVQIAGRGGVADDADAVALNVTAIQPSEVGYVTLYPCDEDRPTTSSLNYAQGGAVGNSAVVSLSATGTLCAFTFADTDLVLDVNAWLADDESFDPLVPARFFETRAGEETVDGEGNGVGRLDAMSVSPIQVAGRGDVPEGASAVALNVTAVRPAGVGFVTLFPCDGDQPLTSSLNYAAGGAVGNSGVVKLAADGTVCAYTQADTDLIIDVNAAWN